MDDLKTQILNNLNILDLVYHLGYKPDKHNKIKSIYNPSENTPSLALYPDTKSFYCFSTGTGGDLFKFYMDSQGVDFKGALEALKLLTNIDISRAGCDSKSHPVYNDNTKKKEGVGSSLVGFEIGAKFSVYGYFISLLDTDGQGLDYLAKRGFDTGFLQRYFRYFDKSKYQVISSKLKAKFSLELLQASGLFNAKGNLLCYCDCIVIIYLDRDLKPVYLQFRNLEPSGSKYLFLSGVEVPTYGLDLVLDVLANYEPVKGRVINIWITEGVFDSLLVIQELAVDRQGEVNLGLAIGSSNKANQLKQVFDCLVENNNTGSVLNIVLAFDSDKAGQEALGTAKSILANICYKNKLQAFEIDLKGYKDLNDFLLGNASI